MNEYTVKIMGAEFDLISLDAPYSKTIDITIPSTDSYASTKALFASNTGNIEVYYLNQLSETYSEYTKLDKVTDNMDTWTFRMVQEYDDHQALLEIFGEEVTVDEAKEYRASIENMTESIPNETADQYTWAFPKYEVYKFYKTGDRFSYKNVLYKVFQDHTSQPDWVPGTVPALYGPVTDPTVEYPEWIQPTGAHNAYAFGAKVSHNEKKWISNTPANVWEPGVYGWDEVIDNSDDNVQNDTTESEQTTVEDTTEEPLPLWEQPTGSHDAYAIGAKVVHNDKTWVNTIASNTYEPGVYGWDEVTA